MQYSSAAWWHVFRFMSVSDGLEQAELFTSAFYKSVFSVWSLLRKGRQWSALVWKNLYCLAACWIALSGAGLLYPDSSRLHEFCFFLSEEGGGADWTLTGQS